MPFVNVKITEGATREQKEKLIEEMTAVMTRVLGKNPATTHIVIEEIAAENWGVRGISVATLRARGSEGVAEK